jgi:hypothetical protein
MAYPISALALCYFNFGDSLRLWTESGARFTFGQVFWPMAGALFEDGFFWSARVAVMRRQL